MSDVITLCEPGGTWVVACFDADCPDHGTGCYAEPWVQDFTSKAAAANCARKHRAEIAAYWSPDHCEHCGQRLPNEVQP